MIVGIDGSNIRSGGGITHLAGLLAAAIPAEHGFSKVIVWSGQATLNRMPKRAWLELDHQPPLDQSLAHRAYWQRFRLSARARDMGCDVLFVPGGTFAGDFRPMVTMSQSLLPFDWRELRRFGWSGMALKQAVLRTAQARTFRHADGVIFLTSYARDVVMRIVQSTAGLTAIIPHGIDRRFVHEPRLQRPIAEYSKEHPLRILYVSIVDVYKHQWKVAEAAALLREAGFPIALTLVGPARPLALRRLRSTLERVDQSGAFIQYRGPIPHDALHHAYADHHIFLFASSCENLPNILLEAMASGMPIASSNRGPMPEVLGDAGAYFDPENQHEIVRALRDLIDSPSERARLAATAFERARAFSWGRCATETFAFLARIASDRSQAALPL